MTFCSRSDFRMSGSRRLAKVVRHRDHFSSANLQKLANSHTKGLSNSCGTRYHNEAMSGRFSVAAAVFLTVSSLQGVLGIDPNTLPVVIPFGFAGEFGPTSGGLFLGGQEVQQIYGSALFASTPTDVFEITGVAFRLDQTDGSGFDLQVPHIAIDMGVSANPSRKDMYANLPAPSRVYSGDFLTFPARTNRLPSDFDIAFSFQTPFRYDRRRGDLILQAAIRDAGSYGTDAEFGAGTKSFLLYFTPLGNVAVLNTVMISQFSGQFLPVITGIQVQDDSIKIVFEASKSNGWILEWAPTIIGPYVAEMTATFASIMTNNVAALVTAPQQSRFWRIRSNN